MTLLHKTRLAVHGERSDYPHFRLIGVKERARLAALGLPFTEHCHGETVTTEPVETKRHLVLKVVALVGVVGAVVMFANAFADWNHTQMLMARV